MNSQKTNGKRNRTAGNSFEGYCKRLYHEYGYPHVVTTRSESRSRDAKKIDLMNKEEVVNGQLPFATQCKSYARKLDYPALLESIDSNLIKVVMHRFTQKRGTKFYTQGEYAILKLEDFFKLIQK